MEFLSFAKTLFFLKLSSEDRLLLLGCGAGTCVMASALLYDLREIRGIDLKEASSFLMMHSMPRVCLRSYFAVVGGCSSIGLLQDRMPINKKKPGNKHRRLTFAGVQEVRGAIY